MEWWQVVVGAAGGLLLLWLALLIALLWAARGAGAQLTLIDGLRLVPDVIRLVRRLAADTVVPRAARVWLVVLLVYLLSPVDLVPDFIPVIGYLDDAIVVALVLRFVVRHAGADALERHWPGTAEGLSAVRQVTGA